MKNFPLLSFILVSLLLCAQPVGAAPKAELWPRWQAHDPNSTIRIDHRRWDELLKQYVITDHPSGINRFLYNKVRAADRKTLSGYIEDLEKTRVTTLNRLEQKAYWINFYNALTIKVILEHYPIQSIRDIDISPGFFSDGPWGKKLVNIEGEDISLDDIEHRILRPIWQDERVHYAVNCASIGCPNLQPDAYTVENTDSLLDQGAREYINHPRGVQLKNGKLVLSSIYDWFQADFGSTEKAVLNHLKQYAAPDLAEKLNKFKGSIKYFYDWDLNQ